MSSGSISFPSNGSASSIENQTTSSTNTDDVETQSSSSNNSSSTNTTSTKKWYAILKPKSDTLYSDNTFMSTIKEMGGLIFPFTPSITETNSSNWEVMQFTHNNYDYRSFTNNKSPTISINGLFVANSKENARLMLETRHFLRSFTKMEQGIKAEERAGIVPPVLLFSAYGKYMYNEVPVIIESYSFPLPSDVDYQSVFDDNDEETKVPYKCDITINLVVQTNPTKIRKEFDLNAFKSGELLKTPGWC